MQKAGLIDESRKPIAEVNKRFSEGFTKGDASITAAGFADDAVIFPPDAEMVRGKQAIEAYWRTVMESGVTEATLTTVEISGSGDYRHEMGTGVLTVHSQGGAPVEQQIKYVVVWKRTAEGWRNAWDIWNSSPAASGK
ncbi:DUF4440 domain-containing protein [Methanoculleus sp. FWC-SCC1]|uniref:DUF4440 domain-containing protein n=1 Tax=Methanoculleus frigidifontis TaxID=2584085 RepID=A0ABT8M744_9EURY|nr:DUF4440 domain-containing protein [Methanoculleus sp. FWC-SCC1]MDN7023760.1 DUF4440 domain-containing protein [Methanoculleus sp. FWC-SCC1]